MPDKDKSELNSFLNKLTILSKMDYKDKDPNRKNYLR